MSSVIVVEGIHDQMAVQKAFPSANIVTTNGSEISKETLDFLYKLSLTEEIIIFTDPDAPGERIRSQIVEVIPNAKHAFIRKKDAVSKNHRKVGVEHASIACIKEVLGSIYAPMDRKDSISLKDLYELKLIGMPFSSALRDRISEKLNLGRPNGKTFLKRINMLNLNRKELKELCQELDLRAL